MSTLFDRRHRLGVEGLSRLRSWCTLFRDRTTAARPPREAILRLNDYTKEKNVAYGNERLLCSMLVDI